METKQVVISDILAQKGINFLSGNHLIYYSFDEPGIESLWFFSGGNPYDLPMKQKMGIIKVELEGKRVNLKKDEKRSSCFPDHMHKEFKGSGIRLVEDIYIYDDVLTCIVQLKGSPGKDIKIEILGEMCLEEPAIWKDRPWSYTNSKFHLQDNHIEVCLTPKLEICQDYDVVDIPRKKILMQKPEVWLSIGTDLDKVKSKIFKHGYRMQKQFKMPKEGMNFSIVISGAKERAKAHQKFLTILKNPQYYQEKAREKWEDFFHQEIPSLDCSDDNLFKVYYHSWYTLKSNIFDLRDTEYIWTKDERYAHPYIAPAKSEWRPNMWMEDTSHIITGAKWWNNPLIAEGHIKTMLEPDAWHRYGLFVIAVWDLFKKTGNIHFLREVFPFLYKKLEYILANRDKDTDYLASQYSSFNIGWDSSCRFNYKGNCPDGKHLLRGFESIDINCYLYLNCKILSQMADLLEQKNIAQDLQKKASRVKAGIQKKMWDKKTGFYYDIFEDTHEQTDIKSVVGFLPLLAKICTVNQKKQLFHHLTNPSEFWRRYVIPTISYDYPHRGRSWSGDITPRNNWFVSEGLANYDDEAIGKELIHKTIGLMVQDGKPSAKVYYDTETGEVHFRKSLCLFATSCSGVLDMIIKRIAGIVPELGDQITIWPFAIKEEWEYFHLSRIRYKNHEFDIQWNKKPSNLHGRIKGYSVYDKGEFLVALEKPNFRLRISFEKNGMRFHFRKPQPGWMYLPDKYRAYRKSSSKWIEVLRKADVHCKELNKVQCHPEMWIKA